jgi:DNA-binding LacI/PurR family transcriptional regulator
MAVKAKAPITANISIKDVARRLNVSPSTVSRALSRPELLSEDTRVRVLEAVEHLGYQPNLARSSWRSSAAWSERQRKPDIPC